MTEHRWLVVDVIPAPTYLGMPPQVVMGTAAITHHDRLTVTLAGGGSCELRLPRHVAAAVAKLVLRALRRRQPGGFGWMPEA